MSDIVYRNVVLVLNSVWQPIGYTSVKKAFVAMCSTQDGENYAAKGIDIDFPQNSDGTYNFESPNLLNPLNWESWLNCSIRDFDLTIQTAKRKIRVPTVIISTNYHKMPMKQLRPTKKGIYDRDEGKCVYSGKKLSRNEASIDHVLPKSRGGKDVWTNLVLADRKINFEKGAKTNEEAGLKLLKQPKAPLPIPASHLIHDIKHFTWRYFLHK